MLCHRRKLALLVRLTGVNSETIQCPLCVESGHSSECPIGTAEWPLSRHCSSSSVFYLQNKPRSATTAAAALKRNATTMNIAAELARLESFLLGGVSAGLRAILQYATPATTRNKIPKSATR